MKRFLQQAEFESDLKEFTATLPLSIGSKEGAKPIGEPLKRTCIYGIPKGGTILAHHVVALLQQQGHDVQLTYNPDHAHFIVDDLYDSGRTKKQFEDYWQRPVFTMYTKEEGKGGKYIGDEWIVFPWEQDHLIANDEEAPIVRLLQMLGEDPKRDGLLETPKRYLKALRELTSGYTMEVNLKTFEKDGFDQLVLLKDIPFFSMCEHHMLPFFGKAHIAYVPNDRIVGLSKLARLVDKHALRLQNQERIAESIAKELNEELKPLGVAVILEAQHLCCGARGVKKPNMTMKTSKITGIFRDSKEQSRIELLELLK